MTLAYSTPIKPTTHRRAFAPLQIHHRLGRRNLLWNPPQMGLKLALSSLHARLRQKALLRFTHPNPPTPMPPANGQSPTMVPNNGLPITTPTAQPFQPRVSSASESSVLLYCRAIDLTMHVARHHRRSQAEATESRTLSPSCSTTAPHILTPSYATDAAA
jgi:hypothetical protein